MQLSYHNIFLNSIKKNTGCSFIGFERYNDEFRVKTIKDGRKEWFQLSGSPSDIKPQYYQELENLIKLKYERDVL